MSDYLPAILFTVDVKHSHDLAQACRSEGLRVYPISGKTPEDERKRFIRLFLSGEIDGLASCNVINEGTDLPNAAAALMCRPLLSQLLYVQQVGRCLRKFPAPQGERWYQQKALDSLVEDYNRGLRNLLLVLATGTGKTRIATKLPNRFGLRRRLLFLVHRDELAYQACNAMQEQHPNLTVGMEKAQYRSDGADIVVASVQTLGTKGKDGREQNARLLAMDPDDFEIIVVDEAHHATAEQYLTILRYLRALKGTPNRDPHKLVVGLTATPNRSDNIGLEMCFERISYEYNIRDAVSDGWLSPITAYRIETETDISQVKKVRGELATGELEDIINTPERNTLIARKYKEICDRRKLGWQTEKDSAVVIDFCDVTAKHSVVTIPTLFGLRKEFDSKGGDVLKQTEEVERLEVANPGLDLRQCASLDTIKASLRRIDLLQPPIVPPEVRRLSRYNWMLETPGNYHLVMPGHFSLSCRTNTLGQVEVYHHDKGRRTLRHVAHDLSEAIAIADSMVSKQDEKILLIDAKWKKDRPTYEQCSMLRRMDKGLTEDYPSASEFYEFARGRYEAGDQRYTKGGISRMIDSKMAARR